MIIAISPQLLASYALRVPRRRVLSYRLPSDLQSPATPLSSTSDSPDRVRKGFTPPSEAPCRAHNKKESDVESAFLKANTKIHFLKIDAGKKFADQIQDNKKINVKFEVDTTPPIGFETEVKVLTPPITASVKVLKPSYLFAGKMHAILFRKWKMRIKGRDFYDLLWYLGQGIPLNLEYLENKMRDGNAWTKTDKLTRDDLIKILTARIRSIDFKNAALDVTTFIKDPLEVAIWSEELFLSAIRGLITEPCDQGIK